MLACENMFDALFEELVGFILNPENDFQNYKDYLFFLLTTDDGDISKYYSNIADVRFMNLWKDKQKNDILSSMIKVILEDLISIKVVEQ